MLNILIPTKPDDTQALYVHEALKRKGCYSVLWYTADFPSQQTHSFELLDEGIAWYSTGVNFEIKNTLFDVVWFRRPMKPTLADFVHPEDIKNAQKECNMLFQSFWEIIGPGAKWVNPPVAAKAANSKLLQLKIALESGLLVPRAMVSNDPSKIREFIASLGDNKEVVCKTLYPLVWHKGSDVRSAYTAEINLENFPSDQTLKIAPCIYQEKIQKAYELRVTYFGSYPVAVKIRSQEHPKGLIDWRYIPSEEVFFEPYQLPELIHQQCQMFMKKLGIVFGCFDFIVTSDNQYYFLEVNEAGQFLWIEAINPKIKMLDIFTEFLTQKNSNFHWSEKPHSVSLVDFEPEVRMIFEKNEKEHLKATYL